MIHQNEMFRLEIATSFMGIIIIFDIRLTLVSAAEVTPIVVKDK